MSYPINISFTDAEFEKVKKAADILKKGIRDFIKTSAIEAADNSKGSGK